MRKNKKATLLLQPKLSDRLKKSFLIIQSRAKAKNPDITA